MADGVKIGTARRDYRGTTIVWKDHGRTIGKTGRAKEYHFRFDSEGIAIVSTTVWERAKQMMAVWPSLPRLIEIGLTGRPPTQRVTGLQTVYLRADPPAPKLIDPRKTDEVRHAGKTVRPVLVFDGGGIGQGPVVPVDHGVKVLPKIELVRAR